MYIGLQCLITEISYLKNLLGVILLTKFFILVSWESVFLLLYVQYSQVFCWFNTFLTNNFIIICLDDILHYLSPIAKVKTKSHHKVLQRLLEIGFARISFHFSISLVRNLVKKEKNKYRLSSHKHVINSGTYYIKIWDISKYSLMWACSGNHISNKISKIVRNMKQL